MYIHTIRRTKMKVTNGRGWTAELKMVKADGTDWSEEFYTKNVSGMVKLEKDLYRYKSMTTLIQKSLDFCDHVNDFEKQRKAGKGKKTTFFMDGDRIAEER